jgi:hypothetical protein
MVVNVPFVSFVVSLVTLLQCAISASTMNYWALGTMVPTLSGKLLWLRERVAQKLLHIKFISSKDQLADIFSKPLPLPLFEACVTILTC